MHTLGFDACQIPDAGWRRHSSFGRSLPGVLRVFARVGRGRPERTREPGEGTKVRVLGADRPGPVRPGATIMDRMKPLVNRHPPGVPPGYPRDFERELRLADGRRVFVRPIVPGDGELLGRAIRGADPDTLYHRFLGSPPNITPALLTHLCTVDYHDRFALVAADRRTGDGVAITRYERGPGDGAEVAIAVDRAWRRAGLATALVEMLAEAALDRGIRTFSALYLAENRPVTALLDLTGQERRQTIRQGFAEAAVALDRADVTAAVRRLGRQH